MAWVATAIDADGTVTKFDNEFTGAKHGTHVFEFHADRDYWVWVHDNTKDGLTEDEAEAIAGIAAGCPIYWSDGRLCYWMYDFPYIDHWVEGLFPNNGLPEGDEMLWRLLQVNVYE